MVATDIGIIGRATGFERLGATSGGATVQSRLMRRVLSVSLLYKKESYITKYTYKTSIVKDVP